MAFHFSPRPNRAHEVRWREWSPEAFREAKQQDRPILLGISAVWCHWCHVMDETSYSDDEVIRLANDRFVPIRVDNDQRPDVNRRYNMGGWPTTAFLTPDGEVLHGGTYIPPEQMRQYLAQVADLWKDHRVELVARLGEARAKESGGPAGGSTAPRGPLTWDVVDQVAALIRGQYDPQYGGFGREPKFPQPKLLRFLLGEYARHAYPDLATMLHKTLGAMAGGGMYDHIEGGFFRYSTTRQWQVPHYEKMLEDNAELLAVYAEAHRMFPAAEYDRVVRDVIRWMDATLWLPERTAFAGSQDADEHYYTLGAEGRAAHGAPYVDRTVYASWNALAASAYVAAARALGDETLEDRAHDVVVTVANELSPGGMLHHYDAGAGAQVPELLTDIAALVTAMLDLYETGRWPNALAGAILGATAIRERLEDHESGGYRDAPEREELGRVTQREKPIEDGSVAADALLRLSELTDDPGWRESAVRALGGFVAEYRQWGQFAAAYATAVARALAEPLVVTVVGPTTDETATSLWRVARAVDGPISVRRVAPDRPGDEHGPGDRERLAALGFPDRTAAYVCVGTVCSAPITDPAGLEREVARAHERFASHQR